MMLPLTRVTTSTDFILSHKLNINKVNLELLVSLNADKKWRPMLSSNDFVGEMSAFENKPSMVVSAHAWGHVGCVGANQHPICQFHNFTSRKGHIPLRWGGIVVS